METVFHRLSKHVEFSQKFSAARRIFNSLLGAWISWWNTVSRVWYITLNFSNSFWTTAMLREQLKENVHNLCIHIIIHFDHNEIMRVQCFLFVFLKSPCLLLSTYLNIVISSVLVSMETTGNLHLFIYVMSLVANIPT